MVNFEEVTSYPIEILIFSLTDSDLITPLDPLDWAKSFDVLSGENEIHCLVSSLEESYRKVLKMSDPGNLVAIQLEGALEDWSWQKKD